MRLAQVTHAGSSRAGMVVGDAVLLLPEGETVQSIVGAGVESLGAVAERAAAGPSVPLSSVTLEVPLTPRTLRDFVAFEEHVIGVRNSIEGNPGVPEAWYDAPTFYFSNPHTLVATNTDVRIPAQSQALDFEMEVGIVIGREGRDVSEADAQGHIFGLTIFNDWSARDIQMREMQVGLGPAKGKDFAGTLGPWIVTYDEFDDVRDSEGFLDLWGTVELNGEVVGRDLLSNIGWNFEQMVTYASRDSRIVPGDVMGSGTFGNGGCPAELWGLNGERRPAPLKDGDVVTVSIERIGTVTNRIVTGSVPTPTPRPRLRDREAIRAARSSGGA